MSMHAAIAEGPVVADTRLSRPYASSWLDLLVGGIERLPGPTWLAYLALSGAAVAFIAIEAVFSSRGLTGHGPTYFAYAFFHVYPLAAYHYLSRGAVGAWNQFRPAAVLDDATADRWQVELTTTPRRPATVLWLAAAAWTAVLYTLMPEGWDLVDQSPTFIALRYLSEALWMTPVMAVLLYLTVRQLRIVSHLHDSPVKVDLMRPRPAHAMSRLTARSAFVLLVFATGAVLPLPGLSEGARLIGILGIALPLTVVAAAVFFLPLRGMHARLAAEQDRWQAEVSSRIEASLATLHQVVDEEAIPGREPESSRHSQTRVDALNKALASLLQERDFVRRLSTWPWDTSTLRAVVSAILLPIGLFLLTRVAERVFL